MLSLLRGICHTTCIHACGNKMADVTRSQIPSYKSQMILLGNDGIIKFNNSTIIQTLTLKKIKQNGAQICSQKTVTYIFYY